MSAWLAALIDDATGEAPNFGPNDGAEVLPLNAGAFNDHRPTVQAATRLLHGNAAFPAGPWDEWSLWLGVLTEGPSGAGRLDEPRESALSASGLFVLRGDRSRGILRAARFETRPGHADQLHIDLWLDGMSVALDAGTYLYNADPPWDNALAGALHHNTVIIDGSEAMIRAGRFLWLKWNQARRLGHWRSDEGLLEAFSAARWGDLARTVTHRRSVVRGGDRLWLVVDDLLGVGDHIVQLSWLLPDVEWRADATSLEFDAPVGGVRLDVEGPKRSMGLYRAGKCIADGGVELAAETLGWFSPTYALKIPALHFVHRWESALPLRVRSRWTWGDAAWEALEIGWREVTHPGLPVEWVRFGGDRLEIEDAYSIDSSGFRRAG